ncbi:MAG: hypothetical protein ACM3KR_01805 [Deltaproteobacteria bacterium]
MKKLLIIFITLLVAIGYVFITDEKLSVDQNLLAQANPDAKEKKLQSDLAALKQKVLVPIENRNSYLLDEQKLISYKDSINDVNNASKKIDEAKPKAKKTYKSRWKKR